MVINTNQSALTATRLLGQSTARLEQSLQRLSSGSKIISPADDSAGLAVAMRLGAKLARLDAVNSNINNAISYVQTQDAYLDRVNSALSRMGELSMMAMDVTKTDSDRSLYQQEFQALGDYIQEVSTKDFNGVSLFSSQNRYVTIDPEIANSYYNTFTLVGINLGGVTLSTVASDDISTVASAQTTLNHVKTAVKTLAQMLALAGTNTETLTFHHDQIMTLRNNLSAANSRIMDVDVAQESTNFARYNILTQAGTAMLAQANTLPQSVLKLLG